MPFLIKALIVFPLFYFTVGRNFFRLWKAGLIGVGLMMIADYIGFKLNLYVYQGELIRIGGFMPLLHIFNVYLISIMYLNWLPEQWSKRILYTVYASALFLAVEAAVFSAGGIIYPNWSIIRSYFLIVGGLSLLAYLSDFVLKKETIA